jgi:hypothetical protein
MAMAECRGEIAVYWKEMQLSRIEELPEAFRGWDMLISQYACLSAMLAYICLGGPSRGSALILDDSGISIPGAPWRYRPYSSVMDTSALQTSLAIKNGEPICNSILRPVRPIPNRDLWFENVWKDYRARNSRTIGSSAECADDNSELFI